MDLITKFYEAVFYGFTNPKPSPVIGKVLGTVVALLLLCLVIYYTTATVIQYSSLDPRTADTNVKVAMKSRVEELDLIDTSGVNLVRYDGQKSLYNDLLKTININQQYLVNLCPLTAAIGGYMGPLRDGVFNGTYYVKRALRAGIRSFVLPISTYLDDNKMPPNWPKSRKPAIVCRNDDGVIMSLNGFSVGQFCTALIQYKSVNIAQKDEPILIYLDGVPGHIPNMTSAEKDYVQFMSDIASELEPLEPYRLTTLKNYGSAVGGKIQDKILTQVMLEDFKNKILIFTNFNVDVETKGAYAAVTPKLYNYVNFIYKPISAATISTEVPSGSRCIRILDVSGSQVDWTSQARTSWHVTLLDSIIKIPDAKMVDFVTKTGIHGVPIPFLFYDTRAKQSKAVQAQLDNISEMYKQWNGYAWRMKPEAARYTKPAEVTPLTPSARLNARVDNSLQPGQHYFQSREVLS